jgi:hypothetical protein
VFRQLLVIRVIIRVIFWVDIDTFFTSVDFWLRRDIVVAGAV